jgi:hypothetical protein
MSNDNSWLIDGGSDFLTDDVQKKPRMFYYKLLLPIIPLYERRYTSGWILLCKCVIDNIISLLPVGAANYSLAGSKVRH